MNKANKNEHSAPIDFYAIMRYIWKRRIFKNKPVCRPCVLGTGGIGMEPVVLAAYTRHYTQLPLLQSAACVEYALYEDGGQLYIKAARNGGQALAVCPLPGAAPAYARDLLRYLYENAVAVEHIRDVIADLRA